MDFDLDDLTEEQKQFLKNIDEMLVPELMGIIEVAEKRINDGFNKIIECDDEDFQDVSMQFMADVLSLRYYKEVLNKRNIDNMTLGELKEEYRKFNKKLEDLEKYEEEINDN